MWLRVEDDEDAEGGGVEAGGLAKLLSLLGWGCAEGQRAGVEWSVEMLRECCVGKNWPTLLFVHVCRFLLTCSNQNCTTAVTSIQIELTHPTICT